MRIAIGHILEKALILLDMIFVIELVGFTPKLKDSPHFNFIPIIFSFTYINIK